MSSPQLPWFPLTGYDSLTEAQPGALFTTYEPPPRGLWRRRGNAAGHTLGTVSSMRLTRRRPGTLSAARHPVVCSRQRGNRDGLDEVAHRPALSLSPWCSAHADEEVPAADLADAPGHATVDLRAFDLRRRRDDVMRGIGAQALSRVNDLGGGREPSPCMPRRIPVSRFACRHAGGWRPSVPSRCSHSLLIAGGQATSGSTDGPLPLSCLLADTVLHRQWRGH